MLGIFPPRKGSLYRRLAIPLSAFVLVASLALVVWISRLYRQESMRRFERMAATNAVFMEGLRLPRSRELARKLSSLLGIGVGFYTRGEELDRSAADGWPEHLHEILTNSARAEPSAIDAGEYDLAIAPLADSRQYLVLVRESEEALSRFGEPFFTEREGGMGIGLTLAREVVQAHDGTIEAFNPPGGGGAVRVCLPRDSPRSSES